MTLTEIDGDLVKLLARRERALGQSLSDLAEALRVGMDCLLDKRLDLRTDRPTTEHRPTR